MSGLSELLFGLADDWDLGVSVPRGPGVSATQRQNLAYLVAARRDTWDLHIRFVFRAILDGNGRDSVTDGTMTSKTGDVPAIALPDSKISVGPLLAFQCHVKLLLGQGIHRGCKVHNFIVLRSR